MAYKFKCHNRIDEVVFYLTLSHELMYKHSVHVFGFLCTCMYIIRPPPIVFMVAVSMGMYIIRPPPSVRGGRKYGYMYIIRPLSTVFVVAVRMD